MIVNSKDLLYVVVELSSKDIQKIALGEEILAETRSTEDDRHVLARVYCDHPEDIKR